MIQSFYSDSYGSTKPTGQAEILLTGTLWASGYNALARSWEDLQDKDVSGQ